MRISDWSSDVCSSDLLRPLKLPQFAWREEANVDKFRHRTNAMHIFADPEQGMQIAKSPLPFLHIGLDDLAAVAHPFMTLLSLGQFLGDEDRCCILYQPLVDATRHHPLPCLLAPDIYSLAIC